ncbi:MAG: 6-carboxytetrahydropterin synthase [Bacteroidales bacterium]|nr:6-carboxytetrahydropterin synthase [Bacteroidales bacterium]MBS3774112.1 6-carboxytetrahydropterin synthase [Bacteroidales bacterium]
MSVIRVTKEFNFEIAHALWNYDGPCKNLHGHSYKLFVTVMGAPINDPDNPKNGMVIDFGDLKHIVNEEIVDPLDHAVILNEEALKNDITGIPQMFDKRLVVSYQPTCENMVTDFARRIAKRLPQRLRLHSLKLHETGSSYAEWHASDNA